MSDHAFLPPSAASSWSICSLWPTMNERFPQEDSAEGIEGTAAHWVAWEMRKKETPAPGAKAPNGVIVTEEMLEGAELFCDVMEKRAPWPRVYIEQQLPIFSIHPRCFGTPDFWAPSPYAWHIELIDYKFGNRFVDEFRNPQGLCYLSGIIDFLCSQWKIGPSVLEQDNGLTISFTIVQPRCYYRGEPVRTHTFKLSETREWFNHLANMAEAATVANPTATTNRHCIDCPGRHACSALQEAGYSDMEHSNQRVPVVLSPVAAALELRMLMRALDRIQARVDGLKEQTLMNLSSGKPVHYFRAEPGYGRQTWNVPDSRVLALGKLAGKDLSKPGLVTPKQAEKMGIEPDIIKAYSSTPSTGFRLVETNPNDAPRTFGTLEAFNNGR